ncbi:hypothetical protein Vadar_004417 [Vaccinium darrowii]|uniref:Uncharacterized protein n=1 Tax=Vaccinium darrowii TaxID=229202 RepID=A0ACB7YTC6_9ERIC|nr:hypothetical protein Vadar_004417 [Vaccinium darrowii]
MASSSQTPDSISDSAAYDLSRSFQNLGLENHDGFFNTNNGVASSSSNSSLSNFFLPETPKEAADIQFDPSFGTMPYELEFPLLQQISKKVNLGYHPFNNGGDTLNSNMDSASENLPGSMGYINPYYPNYYPNDFSGNFESTSYDYGKPSMYDSVNQIYPVLGNDEVNYNPDLYFTGQIGSDNQVKSSAARSNGYCVGNDYNLPNVMPSPGGYSPEQYVNGDDLNAKIFLERHNKAMLAMEKYRSKVSLGLLQTGDSSNASMVFGKVNDSLIILLTYEDGFRVFQSLLSQCEYSQLKRLVKKITSDAASLVLAVGTQFGSHSVQSLIRRLKHTDLARLVTSALATNICGTVSTIWGRNVIKQCLNLLDRRATEVLYDAVIENYYELATDRAGCLTVSHCIDSIESPQRGWLLSRICEESASLSLDPSGTYVVQKVLGLENRKYSSIICNRLQGNYIPLSQLKHGSYTVEKCLKAPDSGGLHYFSKEIAKDTSLLQQLARHEFGNFAVKAAIEVSKKEPSGTYFKFFVKILEPCFLQLEKNTYGAHVVKEIRGQGESSPESDFDNQRSRY